MRIKIKWLDKVIKDFKGVNKAVYSWLLRVAVGINNQLIEETPVDTWRLRWGYRINKINDFTLKIINNNRYGLYVDQGTRPFYPPVRYLKSWARRKGLNPYAVAKSIAKKWIRAQKFVEKAIDKTKDKIDDWFLEGFKL